MTSLAELNRLMSPTRNFAAYRDAIRTVGPPCVPFMGALLGYRLYGRC
jgi:son of sevenless-like protein